jgi:hypothetical protein
MGKSKTKKLIIAAAICQLVFSLLLFYKNTYVIIPLSIYALAWFFVGLNYNPAKRAFWFGIGFSLPWVLLFFIQFLRRLFYLVAYGGELPDGAGSPVAFLIGWAFEMPVYLGLFVLCRELTFDYRYRRAQAIKAESN